MNIRDMDIIEAACEFKIAHTTIRNYDKLYPDCRTGTRPLRVDMTKIWANMAHSESGKWGQWQTAEDRVEWVRRKPMTIKKPKSVVIPNKIPLEQRVNPIGTKDNPAIPMEQTVNFVGTKSNRVIPLEQTELAQANDIKELKLQNSLKESIDNAINNNQKLRNMEINTNELSAQVTGMITRKKSTHEMELRREIEAEVGRSTKYLIRGLIAGVIAVVTIAGFLGYYYSEQKTLAEQEKIQIADLRREVTNGAGRELAATVKADEAIAKVAKLEGELNAINSQLNQAVEAQHAAVTEASRAAEARHIAEMQIIKGEIERGLLEAEIEEQKKLLEMSGIWYADNKN